MNATNRTPQPEDVARYMPLVRQVVARFLRRLPANVLRDDLLAAGVYGLIDSLIKNGGANGNTFESYARIRIRGAILDELRSQDWLPRRARWAVVGKRALTSDTPTSVVRFDDLSPSESPLAVLRDPVDPESSLDNLASSERIKTAVEQLSPRERTIVRMHYFQGARFKDIGSVLGVSEPRVSQLHSRAMKTLRRLLASESIAA